MVVSPVVRLLACGGAHFGVPVGDYAGIFLLAARYLGLILYSRAQIRKENAAMGEDSGSDAPWGIVSVKAQDVASELPMQPITMMRNALGADEGGSGVPLDADKYRESVAYWAAHAPLQ